MCREYYLNETEFVELWRNSVASNSTPFVVKTVYHNRKYIIFRNTVNQYHMKIEGFDFLLLNGKDIPEIDINKRTQIIVEKESRKKIALKILVLFFLFTLLYIVFTSIKSPEKVSEKSIEEPKTIFDNGSLDPYPFTNEKVKTYMKDALINSEYITPYDSVIVLTSKMMFPEIDGLNQEEQIKRAQIIFKWIRENFRYVAEPIEEKKKPFETIQSGYGDCEDFAYLYISMAIASGIPKENIRGVFAEIETKSEEQMIKYHTYVEIKLLIEGKEIWMPVDPTPRLFREYNKENDYIEEFYYYKGVKYPVRRRLFWFTFQDADVFING